MSTLNKVMLIGHLGANPETKTLENAKTMTKFSLATNERWVSKDDNQQQEKTEWHNIVAFGSLGNVCGQFLKSGSLVFVEGKLTTKKYDDNGETKYYTSVVANNVQFLSTKTEPLEATVKTAATTDIKNHAENIPMVDSTEGLPF